MAAKQALQQIAPLGGGLLGLSALGYGLGNCLFTVQPGHRAVKFSRMSGVGQTPYDEGTHFLLPYLEWPIIFDVRTRPRSIASLTGSRDLQMVNITVRTLVRPNETKLDDIYCNLGVKFEEKVLPSIVNEVLKSVVAQFNAAELVQRREQVSQLIKSRLMERGKDFNLVMEDVSITHLGFSPEYEKAVESKQVAQQQAERARFQVLKAQEEKKNIVIKALGEMESAQMIGSAIKKSPGFIELRHIDAAREVANALSKSTNKLILDAKSLLLNVFEGTSAKA